MISAERQNITPETLITRMNHEHYQDFQKFLIDLDCFYTTHSPENQALTNLVYQRLRDNGDISTKTISQAFDPEKKYFWRTVLFAANVRVVGRKINTAIIAKSAAQPTRPRN